MSYLIRPFLSDPCKCWLGSSDKPILCTHLISYSPLFFLLSPTSHIFFSSQSSTVCLVFFPFFVLFFCSFPYLPPFLSLICLYLSYSFLLASLLLPTLLLLMSSPFFSSFLLCSLILVSHLLFSHDLLSSFFVIFFRHILVSFSFMFSSHLYSHLFNFGVSGRMHIILKIFPHRV